MTERALFDPGLQPERTALAWRRTGLALMVASLVAVRVLGEALGVWAALTAGIGLLAAVGISFLAHRRHGLLLAALAFSDLDRAPLPSAGLLLATASFVVAGGLASLLLVLVQ